MTAPEPYKNDTHLVVRGRIVVVTEHAPNADSWHYRGVPADLTGDTVTFGHNEATPVTRPISIPRDFGSVLGRAGLDADVYAQEIAQIQSENEERPRSPLAELLAVVREVAHGIGGQPDIHQAWLAYTEATA
jgi:hypothetical protein